MSATLCTHCTAEKWNLAAAKYRDNRTPENHAAAVAAQREHESAVKAAKSPALLAAAPDLLTALEGLMEIQNVGASATDEAVALMNAALAAIAKAKGGAK